MCQTLAYETLTIIVDQLDPIIILGGFPRKAQGELIVPQTTLSDIAFQHVSWAIFYQKYLSPWRWMDTMAHGCSVITLVTDFTTPDAVHKKGQVRRILLPVSSKVPS